MKQKIKYTKGPITQLERIPDFLPSPAELAQKEQPETVKVTLTLEKSSIDFFKHAARQHGSSYQRMIRNLITRYASSRKPTPLKP